MLLTVHPTIYLYKQYFYSLYNIQKSTYWYFPQFPQVKSSSYNFFFLKSVLTAYLIPKMYLKIYFLYFLAQPVYFIFGRYPFGKFILAVCLCYFFNLLWIFIFKESNLHSLQNIQPFWEKSMFEINNTKLNTLELLEYKWA